MMARMPPESQPVESGRLRIVSVVGARPQFVKLAPVARAAESAGHEHLTVHTGQHHDEAMSASFFRELAIPEPTRSLTVTGEGHGAQTGQMLAALDPVLLDLRPDWVVVYGDTNSTLAGALSAAKLHLPIAHVEAGLRSFNRRMPEEINRVAVDHVSDLLLAPTEVAVDHLASEGLSARTELVGDVMVDALLETRDRVAGRVSGPVAEALGVVAGAGAGVGDGAGIPPYVVATIHRAESTDDPDVLRSIVTALAALPLPVVLAVHPRLRRRAAEHGIELAGGALRPVPPLGYGDLVAAVAGSTGVVTDSGGLQKEAFLLGIPATTVRTETEWVETVNLGWNVLVPPVGDITAPLALAVTRSVPEPSAAEPYGTRGAARRIIEALERASGR